MDYWQFSATLGKAVITGSSGTPVIYWRF